MEPLPIVGIDVAKATLAIAIEDDALTWPVSNDLLGRRRLIRRLQQLRPQLVVLEASGGYEQALLESLWTAQLPVIRVNPRGVRDFARASGRLAKTDGGALWARCPLAGPVWSGDGLGSQPSA
jgi:transposase